MGLAHYVQVDRKEGTSRWTRAIGKYHVAHVLFVKQWLRNRPEKNTVPKRPIQTSYCNPSKLKILCMYFANDTELLSSDTGRNVPMIRIYSYQIPVEMCQFDQHHKD